MKEFFSRSWIVIALIAVFLCLSMSILSAVSGGRISPISSLINIISTPIQSGINSLADGVSARAERAFKYDEAQKENENLKQELSEARERLREASRMELENEQLRFALEMKQKDLKLKFASAEIIARGDDNWSATYTINAGSTSGIAVDNCVITTEGMVGYISEVGATWATVTAVTDPSMEAAAIVSRTRDVASAEGNYELMRDGFFRLSYLSRDTQVLKGDTIETSGVGGLFPKGIVIGYIEDLKTETHGISKYAVVKPAVNLEHLSQVLVITSFEEVLK